LVSFLVGLLGGFVGLALGTLRLPAIILTGLDPRIAGGTNILVSALSALAGGYRHLKERRVNWDAVIWIGGPSVAGTFVGGFFSGVAPSGLLIFAAGLLVMWQGMEFFNMRRLGTQKAFMKGGGTKESAFLSYQAVRDLWGGLAGLAIGLVGGAVGLILGSLRLPLMIRVLRINPATAAGSNLAIGAAMGVFGSVAHGIRGEVDLPLLVAMGLAGMVGSYLGAKLTGRVSISVLVLVMAWVLAVVGVVLVVQGVAEGFG